ncbi:metallophosphoesterase family protein [Lentzea guizhouensis]|uniref:metallophosphoesterase family protein n=1 Tax=Lentzea guizhouensis TaxID=1586287 RepID=UPI0014730C78|nr:metallophosphoesterase [Lentzea guizhouensis]
MTTLLHLSDPHLDGSPERADRLNAVLDLLPPNRQPDAIVLTGDIADNGVEPEYAQFSAVMASRLPWLAVPGNHDTPALLPSAPTLDVGDLRVIGVDVVVPGENHGELRPEEAGRVAELATGARRTVLAFHQPPMRIGHTYVDPMRLLNADALAGLVNRIGTVTAILCGHIHTACTATFAGVPVLVAPGIVSAANLDGDHPAANRDHPPGMALHQFTDQGIVTTFHYAC